nr:uncharacterized protein LOC104088840 isoform X2 [Nicotiana tomentosiformis]
MDSKEPNKCSYAEKRKAAMQLKRRDTQSQISAHSGEAMLLSRRMRRKHSTKHSLLQSPFFAVPQQSTSSWDKAGFLKQTALNIREPPSLPEKVGHQACTPTSWDNLEKGKGILDPPIICETAATLACMLTSSPNLDKGKGILDPPIIRETGSTSGTSNLRHVILNTVPIKAHRRARKVCLVTKEQRSEYVALKRVPNCQFCHAKKFEYEPPGFCCNSGSIRLTSHKMPTELSELYFGNTEESENFRTYIRTYNNMFAFTSLGVKYDKELARRNCGIYTFRVQGQMYHFIDDLVPSNEKPRNL